jgi:2-dehydropantoate 2-reductase
MLTGELLGTPDRRRIAGRAVAEGVRVAAAEGVTLPDVFGLVPPGLVSTQARWDEALERVLLRVGQTHGAIRSVTLRDFELGRPTEIDAVTGEIVRRGRARDVPTPFGDAVFAMLREIEAGTRAPAPANLAALGELAAAATDQS